MEYILPKCKWIRHQLDGFCLTISLNRPNSRNAMNVEMAIEIYETALDKYLKGADRSYDREKTEMEKYLARAKASK